MDSGNKKNLIITVFLTVYWSEWVQEIVGMQRKNESTCAWLDNQDAMANSFQKILTTTLHGDTVHHMETIYTTAS